MWKMIHLLCNTEMIRTHDLLDMSLLLYPLDHGSRSTYSFIFVSQKKVVYWIGSQKRFTSTWWRRHDDGNSITLDWLFWLTEQKVERMNEGIPIFKFAEPLFPPQTD